MFNKIITWWNNFWEWYNNQNKNVRLIIGGCAATLFTYLCINLVDLIFFGEANW